MTNNILTLIPAHLTDLMEDEHKQAIAECAGSVAIWSRDLDAIIFNSDPAAETVLTLVLFDGEYDDIGEDDSNGF